MRRLTIALMFSGMEYNQIQICSVYGHNGLRGGFVAGPSRFVHLLLPILPSSLHVLLLLLLLVRVPDLNISEEEVNDHLTRFHS